MDKIKIRRGFFTDLPSLTEAELGFVKDREELYIGTSSGENILINPVRVEDDGYTLDGYLYPTVDNVHGLGTADKRWQSISVGPGSIHIIAKDTDPGYSVNSEIKIGISSTTGKLEFVNNDNVIFGIDPTNTGITIPSDAAFGWQDRSQLRSSADGAIEARNSSNNDYATVAVATPTTASHAVSKNYLEDVLSGLVLGTSTVAWVETSLGTLRNGDLATNSSGIIGANVAIVKGCVAPEDGGGGIFYWDATSSDSDNGGIIIQPSSVIGDGRWIRIYDGEINVKWFGAVGDGYSGNTDDTDAIQAAIDYVKDQPNGKTLYMPAGVYKITNLNLTRIGNLFDRSVTIRGDGPDTTILEQTIPATGIAVDMSASNNMRVEKLGIRCGANSSAGLLLSRFEDAPNCNLNHFTDFWITSSTAVAGMISIAAESSVFIRCRFWVNAPQAVYIGATNHLGITSDFGTIQTINSNIENHFYGCQFIVPPGNVPVRLTDSCGVEFIGCATYSDNNATPITAHFLVENPTNTDGASWPTRIDHHLFEGKADTGILFKSASHGNGALYQHFHVTNSWMSMEGSWVDIDMSDQGGSLFGILHNDFVFDNVNSPQSQTPGSIHLNEMEHCYISHYDPGAAVIIDGNANACVFRVHSSTAGTLGNLLCSDVQYIAPYGDIGNNWDNYGSINGLAARYIRYTPAQSPPHFSTLTDGIISVADGINWNPLSLSDGIAYPVIYRGGAWRAFHVPHASSHASGGSDELDAQHIDMGAIRSAPGFGSWAADSSIYDVIDGFNQGLLTGGDVMQIGTIGSAGGVVSFAADSSIFDVTNGINLGTKTALDLKANIASPTFTGSIGLVGSNNDTSLIISTGGAATAGDSIITLVAEGSQLHTIQTNRANTRLEVIGTGTNILLENSTNQSNTTRGIIVKHKTTGDAVDNFGAGVFFAIEDANDDTPEKTIGSIKSSRYADSGNQIGFLDIYTSYNAVEREILYLEPSYGNIVGNNNDTSWVISTGTGSSAGDAYLGVFADGNQAHYFRSDRTNNRLYIQGGGNAVKFENNGTNVTNTALGGINLKRTTIADMADGFGAGIHFQIEDTANVENSIGAIIAVRDGADNSGHLELWTNNAGTYAEKVRIGTSGKITLVNQTLNADGSATFPAYSFSGAPGHGMYRDGTTLGFCIDGVGRVAYFNQFGVLGGLNYVQITGAGFLNSGGTNVINMSDNSDVGTAGLTVGYSVSSPGSSVSPSIRQSRTVYTNSGAGSEFAVVLPDSANVGTEFTLYDVGGTGGISFIAPTGESIRVGLSVTSGGSRKVKCTDGAGAELTLVKVTSTLWIQKGSFVGTWVGS